MLKKILLSAIAFLLISQNILFGQSDLPAYDDPDAYEVYSAVLSSPETDPLRNIKNFIIRRENTKFFKAAQDNESRSSVCLYPDAESEKIIGAAIDDYIKINKTDWQLQDKFKLEIPYRILSSENIFSILKAARRGQFYEQDPGSTGFIGLSAVGFNADKTVAVVSKTQSCGPGCSKSKYFVLHKKDGKWIPLEWKGNGCSLVSYID